MQKYSLEAIQREIVKLAAPPNSQNDVTADPSSSQRVTPPGVHFSLDGLRNQRCATNRQSHVLRYTYPLSNFARGTSGALNVTAAGSGISQAPSTSPRRDCASGSSATKPTTPPRSTGSYMTGSPDRLSTTPPRKPPLSRKALSPKSPSKESTCSPPRTSPLSKSTSSPCSPPKASGATPPRATGSRSSDPEDLATENVTEVTVEREPAVREQHLRSGHHVWAQKHVTSCSTDVEVKVLLKIGVMRVHQGKECVLDSVVPLIQRLGNS